MKVTVRFFAGPREKLGVSELLLELPAGSTVRSLADTLVEVYPDLGNLRLKYAVNSAYVDQDTALSDRDEVACIPPVGGG